VSSKLEHASCILERHNGDLFRLSAFFGPQHGFLGQTQDNMVEWKNYEHPRLRIPIYSLYGEHREPVAEMLTALDVLLVDLQDVGARYYTFIWTLYLCMRACEKGGTTRPFEIFGAPFINAETLCQELNALRLPGLFFRENYFQPMFQKFAGELCSGAQIHVTCRNEFRPFQTGIEIIRVIRKLYPDQFSWKQPPYEYETEKLPIEILLGGPVKQFFAD